MLAAINTASANEPTAWLGLHVTDADLSVDAIAPGGPAEAAGIQLGDVITAVDGAPATSFDAIKTQVQSHHPGETATLSVLRAGATDPVDIDVVLGANQGAL
jgi:putative serine protease PepD